MQRQYSYVEHMLSIPLFKERIRVFTGMPRLNDDHGMCLQMRTLQAITTDFQCLGMGLSGSIYFFVQGEPQCLSVTPYRVDEYEESCSIREVNSRYYIYLLPYKPKEVVDAMAEYCEESTNRRKEENKMLFH